MIVHQRNRRSESVTQIDVHADDYCISPHSSNDILQCLRAGRLNSISVLTNMSCFVEYAGKLKEEMKNFPEQPLLSVHLNFMEGHCLAEPEKVPDLVDENGNFNISWGNLFVWNYSPKKFITIKKELKAEIKAQTDRFIEVFGNHKPLRFDGHQHTQMLPIVYWALLEVIVEQRYRTEYIRITKEPIIPYLQNISLWKTYSPVNWIKNLILNFYSPGMERTLREAKPSWQDNLSPMFLWGVVMSGNMDIGRVCKLLPDMKKRAEKRGRTLEVLFHPGTILKNELTEEFSNEGANGFHISKGRQTEYNCVLELGKFI